MSSLESRIRNELNGSWSRKALLNVSDADPNTPNDLAKNETLVPGVTEPVEEHEDERQIQLDTDRSFVLYPVGEI